MEWLRELGDPDELVQVEDLVVLQLEKPLPPQQAVPKHCRLDSSRLLITLDQEAFIVSRGFLSKLQLHRALLAGCSELTSAFGAAAKEVLSGVRTLAIVHNRDLVCDLVNRFPRMETLVLLHDLRLQSEPEPRWNLATGQSRLRCLLGTTPGVGSNSLFLCPITITSLLASCSWLQEVQSPMQEIVILTDPSVSQLPVAPPCIRQFHELILGCQLERLDGAPLLLSDTSAACIGRAARLYPRLFRLQVTTSYLNSLSHIAHFTDILHLSVMFANAGFASFACLVVHWLRKFNQLQSLDLKFFEVVKLSVIALHCKQLRSLQLLRCNIADEVLPSDAFQRLETLRLDSYVPGRVLCSLVTTGVSLVCLHLDGDIVCATFLNPRVYKGHLMALERLTLRTELSLPALGVTLDDLQLLVMALPSLRLVATDSYDLRLFFERHAPSIRLSWTTCTVCAAEFPKISKIQSDTWHMVHFDDT